MNPVQLITINEYPSGKACCELDSSLDINDSFFMHGYGDFIYRDGHIRTRDESHTEYLEMYIRRATDTVYLIPCMKPWMYLFESERMKLFHKCALFMTVQQYNQIRDFLPQFPLYETIPVLTKMDCARIFWVEVPMVIRSSTDYKFDRKGYLGTDAPEREEIIKILEAMVTDYSSSQDPVTLEPASANSEITIILDTADYFEWKALCKVDDGYGLRLEPGYKVLPV